MKRKQKFPNQTVERLTALRCILNMHERAIEAGELCKLNGESRKFDMSDWDCGTAACALGSSALNPWFKERGLTLKYSKDYNGMVPCLNGLINESEEYFMVGVKFFGITRDEASNLFLPWNYLQWERPDDGTIPPGLVRDRVNQLIKKYSK